MTKRYLTSILSFSLAAAQILLAHDPHDPFAAVAASPNYAQDHSVFAATDALSLKLGAYALLKSADGGVTWSVVSGLPNNGSLISIVFSPAYSQDQTVVIGGSGGLFLTANQGISWKLVLSTGLLNVAISANFAADNTLFVVTSQKTILKSANRGQTWTSVPPPAFQGATPSVIAISPNFAIDNTLLLGTNADGIFKSANGGASWVHVTSGSPSNKVSALSFSPAFSSDQTAFAATLGSGVLLSTTAGASWAASNSGIADLQVSSLELSPSYAQDSTIWITTAVAGVFRSATQGQSWTAMSTVTRTLSPLACTHYQALSPAGAGPSPVLFLVMYEGLWASADGAVTWRYIDTLPTRLIRHINLSPNYAQDQTVFASTYGGGNLWSITGGSVWTFQNVGMQFPYTDASGISPNFAVDGTAFSSNSSGLQRTSDQGATWQLMQGLGATYPRSMAVSPAFAQDATVLIGLNPAAHPSCSPGGSAPEGLFLSTDGGNTWINTSLSGVAGIISIAMSPAFAIDRTAFAASPSNGLYKSTDGGMTWVPVAAQPTRKMAIVAFSPSFATDGTVFSAGTIGGIYRSADRGATWSTVSQSNAFRVLDLQVSPNYATDRSFFAGTAQNGLVKFTQSGANMVPVTSFPDQFVTAVAISPHFASDHTLFASGYHGLYKSTNGGSAWTYLAAPARIEESQNITGSVQQPPIVTFLGSWSTFAPSPVASTNAYMLTAVSQDTVVENFMGTGIAWVTSIGPNQGRASIQLDGVPQGTVSLTAPVDQYQQVVWKRLGLVCGLHSLTITGLLQSGQTVSVDAFNVWMEGCPLK